jgi:hypothetical protein
MSWGVGAGLLVHSVGQFLTRLIVPSSLYLSAAPPRRIVSDLFISVRTMK